MIWIIEGNFGSGKTTAMVKHAREFARTGDYKIITNTAFSATKKIKDEKGKTKYIPAEVITIENKMDFFNAFATAEHALFLLDEGGIWLNNYNWKNIPEAWYERFQQTRKADIHFISTVRHFEFVANKLRQITDAVIECKAFPRTSPMSLKPPKRPWIIQETYRNPVFYEKTYVPEEEEKKYIYGRRFLIRNSETWKAFDTNKLITNKEIIRPKELIKGIN